jgi:hypothetical protein
VRVSRTRVERRFWAYSERLRNLVGGDCKEHHKYAHFNAPYSTTFQYRFEDAEVRSEDVFLYNGTLGESFTQKGIVGF